MPIRQTTPMAEVDHQIEQQVERQKRVLVRNLAYIGEQVVNEARARNGAKRGSYTDRTGNLRSSIGYIIVMDGKVVKRSKFEVVNEGREGARDGKDYAERLAGQYPQGVALIVVAGMRYAKYVQKLNFDVTFSAEALASRLLHKLGMPNTKRISQ